LIAESAPNLSWPSSSRPLLSDPSRATMLGSDLMYVALHPASEVVSCTHCWSAAWLNLNLQLQRLAQATRSPQLRLAVSMHMQPSVNASGTHAIQQIAMWLVLCATLDQISVGRPWGYAWPPMGTCSCARLNGAALPGMPCWTVYALHPIAPKSCGR
jgi:hypothetical protein